MASIVIVGTSGFLGTPVLDALTSGKFDDKIKFPIKALTTKDKSKESTDKLEYIQAVTYDESVFARLKNTDVLISLVGKGSPEVVASIENLVLNVKPKLYIPSEFGGDQEDVPSSIVSNVGKIKNNHVAKIRSNGIKATRINNAFFRIPPVLLYSATGQIGIDQTSGTITLPDEKTIDDLVVDFSTAKDVGYVVAAIATTDIANVKDKYRVRSRRIPLRTVVNDLESKGQNFTVVHVSSSTLVTNLQKDLSNFALAVFVYWCLGEGNGVLFPEIDNELVNPGETLWTWDNW